MLKLYKKFQLLIGGVQLLKVSTINEDDKESYKSTLCWKRNSSFENVTIHLPAQLAVQLGMKEFYDVHNVNVQSFSYVFDSNETLLNANLLCGLNCLKLNSNTLYPIANYNLLKVRLFDIELSNLLKGETKVIYKNIASQFIVQKLSVKSVNFDILNEFDKPLLLHHCEIFAECRRNKGKI